MAFGKRWKKTQHRKGDTKGKQFFHDIHAQIKNKRHDIVFHEEIRAKYLLKKFHLAQSLVCLFITRYCKLEKWEHVETISTRLRKGCFALEDAVAVFRMRRTAQKVLHSLRNTKHIWRSRELKAS